MKKYCPIEFFLRMLYVQGICTLSIILSYGVIKLFLKG